jgi:hypothetical protein
MKRQGFLAIREIKAKESRQEMKLRVDSIYGQGCDFLFVA